MTEKNAIVVEGGAMRSIFAAGVLDTFLQHHFDPFHLAIGVSAGAANLLFYLAGLQGQSRKLFLEAASRREFINPLRFMHGGHLVDLDWLFQHFAVYYQAALQRIEHRHFLITMTSVTSGNAVYAAADLNLADSLKASMALPLLYRGFPTFQGAAMTDGGIANGIPVDEAIRQGATRIMVVRSRHCDYSKKDTLWHRYIRFRLRRQSALVATMRRRVQLHEQCKQLLMYPPQGIQVIDLYPPVDFDCGRFVIRRDVLQQGYTFGQDAANQAMRAW